MWPGWVRGMGHRPMAMTATAFFNEPAGSVPSHAEDAFFGGIKLGNDTFKLTRAGRLADLDAWLLAQLGQESADIDQMLDIGVSSGVTTLDLVEQLRRAGYARAVTATDLAVNAYILPVWPGCRALVDRDGHALQYDVCGWALRPWRRRLDMVDGMVMVRWALNALCRDRLSRLMRDGPPAEARTVRLVSPRLDRAEDIRVEQDDIMVRNPAFVGRFDLIRAANILNRDYFAPRALGRAMDNAIAYLSGPGAWLLIGRTLPDSTHHASLFRLDETGRLVIADRFGAGSEVEEFVLGGRC